MSQSYSKFYNHEVKAQEVFSYPDFSDRRIGPGRLGPRLFGRDVSPPDILDLDV